MRYHENRGTQACISHIVSKEHLEMYIYILYIYIYIQYTILYITCNVYEESHEESLTQMSNILSSVHVSYDSILCLSVQVEEDLLSLAGLCKVERNLSVYNFFVVLSSDSSCKCCQYYRILVDHGQRHKTQTLRKGLTAHASRLCRFWWAQLFLTSLSALSLRTKLGS